MFDNEFKVRLGVAGTTDLKELRERSVTFDVTPDLSEQRTVVYDSVDPVHAPGQFMVYKKTSARRFQLTQIRLVSRTRREASQNLAILWILRGWTMPSFGIPDQVKARPENVQQRNDDSSPYSNDKLRQIIDSVSNINNRNILGSPPEVLELSAYSRLGGQNGLKSLGHLRRVPVVIESLGIYYPSEVDYIPTEDEWPTPMPTVMNVDISLTESQSPQAISNFSLENFKRGELLGF